MSTKLRRISAKIGANVAQVNRCRVKQIRWTRRVPGPKERSRKIASAAPARLQLRPHCEIWAVSSAAPDHPLPSEPSMQRDDFLTPSTPPTSSANESPLRELLHRCVRLRRRRWVRVSGAAADVEAPLRAVVPEVQAAEAPAPATRRRGDAVRIGAVREQAAPLEAHAQVQLLVWNVDGQMQALGLCVLGGQACGESSCRRGESKNVPNVRWMGGARESGPRLGLTELGFGRTSEAGSAGNLRFRLRHMAHRRLHRLSRPKPCPVRPNPARASRDTHDSRPSAEASRSRPPPHEANASC